MKAIWNGKVIAESDATRVVEGNHYFPPDAIHRQYFEASEKTTYCGWKGLRTRDRIDWLLISGPVRVRRAVKMDKAIKGRWPSDHYALFTDLELF